MAMICVNGCKECDGCMACQDNQTYMVQCEACGEELDPNDYEVYEDEDYEWLCRECLLRLHLKGI